MKQFIPHFIILIFSTIPLIGQSIVANYPFNGNANDESGNNHPSYVGTGVTLTTDRFEMLNNAYYFDGNAGSFISIPADNFPTMDRTISFWFKADDQVVYRSPFSYGGNGCNATCFLLVLNQFGSGNYTKSGHCDLERIVVPYAIPLVNPWKHWVLTVNGTTQKIYIDGNLQTPSVNENFITPTYTAGRSALIGAMIYTDGNSVYQDGILNFKGKLDDIRIYDDAMTDSQVQQLYENEASGLVAYYPFNGNANDESTFQNHGIVNSATGVFDRFDNSNSAYLFNGNSDYITVPNNNQNALTTNLTLSVWAKRTRFGIDIIMEKGGDWTAGTCNYGVGLHQINDNMFYFFFNGGWRGTNGVNDFNWHHYAVVAQNGDVNPKLYIDGILKPIVYSEGSNYINLFANNLDLHIGSQIGAYTYFGANNIDDIKLFERSLSDVEILQIFESESSCYDPLHAVISSPYDYGPGTLRAAINCIESGGTITWNSATDRALLTSPIIIDKNITISNSNLADNSEIIIDLLNTSSGLIFNSNAELTLNNVDIMVRNHTGIKPVTEGNGSLIVMGTTGVKKDLYPHGTVHCDPAFSTEIVDVTNPITGRTWMDRNLGATRAAISSTDVQAFGDFYQWGRLSDGHHCRNSATTIINSDSDVPGHSDFILEDNTPYDWRTPINNDLWQGINGINNPCPVGYRIPTYAEWEEERISWSTNTSVGAFDSPLKLTTSGNRNGSDGSLVNVGAWGHYWCSSIAGTSSYGLDFFNAFAYMGSYGRSNGLCVRCIKE